jgi:hypothetical protein
MNKSEDSEGKVRSSVKNSEKREGKVRKSQEKVCVSL